jgi:integrase
MGYAERRILGPASFGLGKVALNKLRPAHIVNLYSRLRIAERRSSRPGLLSGTTRRSVPRTLQVALKHAVKWRLIPSNPADAVDTPQTEHKEMLYFTPKQVVALMGVVERTGYPWHGFYAVAVSTGMRLGELVGLRWQDIDLERGRLTVQQKVQRLPKIGIVAKAPKTAGSRRPIDLGPEVVTILRQHRIAQAEHRLKIGKL